MGFGGFSSYPYFLESPCGFAESWWLSEREPLQGGLRKERLSIWCHHSALFSWLQAVLRAWVGSTCAPRAMGLSAISYLCVCSGWTVGLSTTGYGPCGSGTRAPRCQSTSWICNEASMVVMIMMRTMVTRMPIMGVMVRFYIVLHDFILISYDYHDH